MSEFIFPVHVFAEDTDYNGVVYHANYIKYMERARSIWAIQLDCHLERLAKENIFFVVKSIAIDYLFPARLDDNLEVVSTIVRVGKASITFMQNIRFATNPEKILTKGEVITVCIDEKLKPRALPKAFLDNYLRKTEIVS